MFFMIIFLFSALILGITFFPLLQNFITAGGFELFLTELTNKQPLLPLNFKKNKKETILIILKHIVNKPIHLCLLLSCFIFLGSFSLYLKNGNYNYQNQPLIKKLEAKKNTRKQYLVIAAMLADRLEKNSENGKDWRWLGQVLFMAHDYNESANAFRNAIKYGEDSAEVYAELGETLTMQQNGTIMADALRAFMSALRYDRYNLKASYFLALSSLQKNDEKKAVAILKHIIKNTDPKNKWHISAKEHIKEITSLTNINLNAIEPLDLSVIARGFEP